jgi:hypothetical protein
MASNVELGNMALAHLGSDAQITSVTPPDGSKEAGYVKAFLATARRELLESYEWRFAVKRAVLGERAINPSQRWLWAYVKPSDCLKPRRILSNTLVPDSVFTTAVNYPINTGFEANDSAGAHYQLEAEIIYTNEPDATLLYLADVEDLNKVTPMFYSSLGYLLASYLAGPIVRGKAGVAAAQRYRELALSMAAAAMTSDANTGQESAEFEPMSVSAR